MDLSAVKNSEVYSTLEDLPTDEGSIYHASCMSGASDTNKKKELRMIHITKCAGSSLESISNKTWGKHDHDYLAAVSDVHTIDAAFWHVPLRFAKPYVLRDLLKKYDYFTVVRNPYERVVSEYFCPWGGAGSKRQHSNVSAFNEWIHQRLKTVKSALQELENVPVSGHWAPQHLYVTDSTGKVIVHKDNVIMMEDLSNQYAALKDRYHLPSTFVLPNDTFVNPGPRKIFTPLDLDRHNIALIQDVYRLDFAYFGYNTEPPVVAAAPAPGKSSASGASGASGAAASGAGGGAAASEQSGGGAYRKRPLQSETESGYGRDNAVARGAVKKAKAGGGGAPKNASFDALLKMMKEQKKQM
jgi:hypothetical protein